MAFQRAIQARTRSVASQETAQARSIQREPAVAHGGATHQFDIANLPLFAPSATSYSSGLPHPLRSGLERAAGAPMHDVRVHYNSPHAEQLDALAFTRGNEIHVAPGQEKHLPHEAWHVVQQRQGRVKATTQVNGAAVNDSAPLEREADIMGQKLERSTPDSIGPVSAPVGAMSGSFSAQPAQLRGSRTKRRARWRAQREGRQQRGGNAEEPGLNLEDLGNKHVTVYRVEHDAKPAILESGGGTPHVPNQSRTVTPRVRKPGENVRISDEAPEVNWVSFNTPGRAIANLRQRVQNQLEAHKPGNGPRTLPPEMMPKLKSFKVTNEFAKRIQSSSVLERDSAAHPSRPINSDQNWAPNQFGLKPSHLNALRRNAIPGSYMEYDQSDLTTLASIHGSGKSANDHMRKDPYPKDQLRSMVPKRRSRGSGKRGGRPGPQLPNTYDPSKDPGLGGGGRIDPEARQYLYHGRQSTLGDWIGAAFRRRGQ